MSLDIEELTISYGDAGRSFTGVLHRPAGQSGPLPGILLIHGGTGLDAHARGQAHRYAALGYVVFAADMFGEGVAGDRGRVMARLTALRDDPESLVACGRAGLAVLSHAPLVSDRYAAVGFCFGGLVALTLARAGTTPASTALAGAVSVHGTLATVAPAHPGTVTARLLVCHGANDPHVPMTQVSGFAEEMGTAGADWQLTMYGGAEHGFTHEHAIPGATPGVSYHAATDARSFADIRAFLADVLTVRP
jgi:dienelactone hydrolase